jgi:hypothetical protein
MGLFGGYSFSLYFTSRKIESVFRNRVSEEMPLYAGVPSYRGLRQAKINFSYGRKASLAIVRLITSSRCYLAR